jgi:hypothetical protein
MFTFCGAQRWRPLVLGCSVLSLLLASGGCKTSRNRSSQSPAKLQISKNLMLTRCLSAQGNYRTYSYTLVSRLGEALTEAEELFGPRNPSYTILGVEFTPGRRSRLQQPKRYPQQRYLIIQLSQDATANPGKALRQLAHEALHLLSPTPPESLTVLEEGLATYFSLRYLQARNLPATQASIGDPRYWQACQQVRELLDSRPDSLQQLRALRQQRASFSGITPHDLQSNFPNLPQQQVASLTRRFQDLPSLAATSFKLAANFPR